MSTDGLPKRLVNLHRGEEQLRIEARSLLAGDRHLQLHIAVVEQTMDLTDILRQFPTVNEDLKVVQLLGMRTFNAFSASMKLALSGYFQNSALIMRDILETAFLLELFNGDNALIEQWRMADKRRRMKQFSPVKVRIALDKRDGFTKKKRAETYELFSELAGHPSMKSAWMMRPTKDGNAVIGAFMEKTALAATISEMGRLAIQVGEAIDSFFPDDFERSVPARLAFQQIKKDWIMEFYPDKLKN